MKTQFRENARFLRIDLYEAYNFDRFIEFVTVLGGKNAEKVLIDGTKLENTALSHKERFDIGITAIELLDNSAKYVVIWPVRDINYFAISVMRLKGFNIKVFANKTLAIQWLLD